MSRKSSEVIKACKKMIDAGYVYVYGYKGTKVTKQGITNLVKSYPSVFTSTIKSLAMKKVGKIGIDCSGFVNKACNTNLGGSTNIKDSFKKCYKISNDDFVVDGMGIWHQGHIAIIHVDKYGKASIYEARSTAKDLTHTSWAVRAKDFTYYGKIAGVDYSGANIKGIGSVISAKTKGSCNIYKKRDPKTKKLFKLDNGTHVSILKDCGNGWSKVWYKGVKGYIKNTALNLIATSNYPKATLKHNAVMRKSNSKMSKKIKTLKKGTILKVICKRKYWSNIVYEGKSYWVPTKYL